MILYPIFIQMHNHIRHTYISTQYYKPKDLEISSWEQSSQNKQNQSSHLYYSYKTKIFPNARFQYYRKSIQILSTLCHLIAKNCQIISLGSQISRSLLYKIDNNALSDLCQRPLSDTLLESIYKTSESFIQESNK